MKIVRRGVFPSPVQLGVMIRWFAVACAMAGCPVIAQETQQTVQIRELWPDKVFGDETSEIALYFPTGIAVDAKDFVYVVDSGNCRVVKFSPDGKFVLCFGRKGKGPGEFQMPWGIVWDPAGDLIFVSDVFSKRIEIFCTDGVWKKSISVPVLHPAAPMFCLVDADQLLMSTYDSDGFMMLLDRNGRGAKIVGRRSRSGSEPKGMWHYAFNARVATDRTIWVVFRYQPVVQKYKPDFELLFEKRFHDPDFEETVQRQHRSKEIFKMKGKANHQWGGILFCTDIQVDGQGGLWMAVSGKIYHLDREGNILECLIPYPSRDSKKRMAIAAFCLDRLGRLYTVSSGRMKIYRYNLNDRSY